MGNAFLTLNLPKQGLMAGTPIVATQDRVALRAFKEAVLREWQRRVDNAPNETLREIDHLELTKLEAVLALLITGDDGEPQV